MADNRQLSATVFVKYAEYGSITGHAAMLIGAINSDDLHDYINNQVDFNPKRPIQQGIRQQKFWEDAYFNYEGTFQEFQEAYHVYYRLYGLDVDKMLNARRAINHTNVHYNFLIKNCATIIARILKAGGVDQFLSPFNKIFYGHNLYWTPKDIAQLCDKLKNINMATKHKYENCPKKRNNIRSVLAGFR
ncbi:MULTISPECIES: hypothetical protein [Xenorhabdus]|uniref:RTX toxin RtxA n=1 Tax=Xenorhabdus ehlersii TaxID=290111 RepID=A0A2D0IK72_9GAMM|nr:MULTISPECIES: hypothetical protein [Xenorhabdus]MBC8951049.1 RTX toxin RtxA [Xenorhabdus sp. TS4]PHM22181.1 RTX toxin RtxA [Xenorhabdus ehlersii]RKE87044.1 hypothetical protein BDE27_3850 [Xenorhabdus ehlersii]